GRRRPGGDLGRLLALGGDGQPDPRRGVERGRDRYRGPLIAGRVSRMAPVPFRSLLSFVLLPLVATASGVAPPATPAAGSAPVVRWAAGGPEGPAARRRAVEQAILAAADAAGVVVCRDNASLTQPESAALDRVCATQGLPRLWWDAEIGTETSGEVEVLDVFLKVAIGGPPGSPAESPRSIAAPHAILPANTAGAAGAQGEERETAILD